ncbi:SHOCT domain-containing protein [Labedaea rhizosphaerae]|uniref:Uncharacterized protein n=1 Tax=Labedaea rhizosphaerae TaxID=598644 RepID=A0A4R6SME9_LABRH|nr:SHOCT domain-containing protein [Labedaea rhizosphaerae]TDQ05094.1 hypothetical protein EV186_1011059 [Labedaea rhizosphaerae]
MDWQDELRTLDGKLTEGEISQAEYRKLRDQVLAEASSGGPVHRPVGPEHHDRVHIPSSAAEEAPSGEMTQVISTEEAADEKTLRTQNQAPVQTVQSVQTAPPLPELDADKTVVVGTQKTGPASAYQPPVRAAAPPPPPPWETGPATPAPMVQGNEVFSVARKESSAKKAALGSLAVLLVLALIGAGVWFFVLRDDDQPTNAGGPNPGTTVVPKDTDPGSQIPSLPGVANANDGTMSADRAVQLKIIAPAEAALLKKLGADQLVFRGSTGEFTGYSLIAVRGEDPKKTTDGLSNYLTQNGFQAAGPVPGGYPVLAAHYGDVTMLQTVYTSGAFSVNLGVARKGGSDAALRDDLTKALGTLAKALPRT